MTRSDTRTIARFVTVAVAAGQAALLIGYAVSIAAVALTEGLSGPQDVSSPAGTAVEVAVFALFGAGLGTVAWGRWRAADWSTVPFVVTQLLALVVGIPMATGSGGGVPAGIATTVAAGAGLMALIVAAVTRPDEPEVDLRPAPRNSADPRRSGRH